MAVLVEAALRGGEHFWGAPTFDQVRTAWREFYRAAGTVAEFKVSDREIIFPSGGTVRFRSLDNPDNARSLTADTVVIDEAGDVAEEAWYEVLQPMLVDTRGSAWILGTPKGQNWFWRESQAAATESDSRFWNAPTLGVEITEAGLIRRPHPLENPTIGFDEILRIYRKVPERSFRQEILAEFIEESGGVFRGVTACVDVGRTLADEPAGETCLGVDLARVEDWTVLTVLNNPGRQMYHERFNQISWTRQVERICEVAGRYQSQVVMDSTGVGDPIFEALRGRGLTVIGYHFTNASKEQLIDALAMDIENTRLRLMDLPIQTNELQGYRYELTPSRNVKMQAPPGMHDDCVTALGLANWGRNRPRGARMGVYG